MNSKEPALLRLRTPVLRALSLLAAMLLSALLAPGAAWANCGGQTYTYTHTSANGGGTSRSLNSGQSLRIQSGTFTANIDNLASTAKICIDSGATFQPGNLNNISGQVVNYGTINFGNVNLSSGFKLDNFGTTNFTSSANFNGAATFNNRANANLYFRQTVQLGNGSTFNNDGYVQADGNLNLASGTTFINTFDILIKDTFNPSGVVNNTGRVHALAFININGGSAAKNWCSWIADGGFNNNSNLTENYGLIFINWTNSGQAGTNNMWQNNQTFKMGPDSIVYGWRFMNNSTITNTSNVGGGRFFFKMPNGTSDYEHTKNQGPFNGLSATNKINFYDETQTGAGRLFDSPQSSNQNYTNAYREYFEPPPINYAAPTCSPAIRQLLDGTWDPDGDGEVEPPPAKYDYSDAPISYGAPFHRIIDGLHLGTVAPDWDGNGDGDWNGDGVVDNMSFNTPNADGDDLGGISGLDDEDGIASMPTLVKGQQATLDVRVTGAGYLTGWIDYDGNGTFQDTSAERIAYNAQDNGSGTGLAKDNTPANDGIIRLIFTPPANAAATKSYIRLRWSASQSLGPTNPSTSGEVEDYTFTFGVAPEPELPPGGGDGAGGGSTSSSCTAPELVTIKTGYGVSQSTSGTVTNPAQSIGAIAGQGAYASASNSAVVGANGVLTIDLIGGATNNPNNIPAGGDVVLSLSRGSSTSTIQVQVSANGTSWTTIGTYGAGGSLSNDFNDGVLKRVMFEAPAGGIRYVRINRTAGTFWVDGVMVGDICGIPASLTIVKSSEHANSGEFSIPGNDIVYSILVTNSGTLPVDANSVLVVDVLPSQVTFVNSALAPSGNPVTFSQSSAGLNFSYATDVAYSNLGITPTAFTQCTYAPSSAYDVAVKHVCIRPSGTMAGGQGGTSFTVRFKARIK